MIADACQDSAIGRSILLRHLEAWVRRPNRPLGTALEQTSKLGVPTVEIHTRIAQNDTKCI